jgi:hypothetical protein
MHRNLAKTSTRRTVLGAIFGENRATHADSHRPLTLSGVQPAAAISASRIGTTVEDVKSRYSLNR